MAGQTRKLACPGDISLLADGEQVWTCGNLAGASALPQTLQSFTKKTVKDHEFLCVPGTAEIHECAGDGTSLADGNIVSESGDWVTDDNDINHFCAPDGTWVTDLNTDEDACNAAKWEGVAWTGTKCCGDPADEGTSAATYEDSPNGLGGCYDNTFISSGSTLDTDTSIINHQGKFYACDPTLNTGQEQSKSITLFEDTGVTVTARGECGMPLLNTLTTGTTPHTICMPFGSWAFTASKAMHELKSTSWAGPAKGCCPENKCWDGTRCRDVGEYYQVADRGFRCQ